MGLMSIEFVRSGKSSEACGCPEEEWMIGQFELLIHAEPDQTVSAYVDGGDYGAAASDVVAGPIDAARADLLDWAQAAILGGA